MSFDYELTLIGESGFTKDNDGNEIPIETSNVILCSEESVTRNEFYSAAKSGIKPTNVFVIHKIEYNKESLVEFEKSRYKVIKTYSNPKFPEYLELTCEEV